MQLESHGQWWSKSSMQLSHKVQWTVLCLAGNALFPGWEQPVGQYIIHVSQNFNSVICDPFPATIMYCLNVGRQDSCYDWKWGSILICLGTMPGSVNAVLNREIFVKIQIIKWIIKLINYFLSNE